MNFWLFLLLAIAIYTFTAISFRIIEAIERVRVARWTGKDCNEQRLGQGAQE